MLDLGSYNPRVRLAILSSICDCIDCISVLAFEFSHQEQYNVTCITGIVISAFTTVLLAYPVDCHQEHSARIGILINLISST